MIPRRSLGAYIGLMDLQGGVDHRKAADRTSLYRVSPPATNSKAPRLLLARRAVWLLIALAVHLALAMPGLVARATQEGRIERYDERYDDTPVPPEWRDADGYHLPLIDAMRLQWPAIDIVNYDAATAPGYHAFMATLAIMTGGREGDVDWVLWIANLLFGLGLIAVVQLIAARWVAPPIACMLTLPLAASPYVVSGTSWLTTDNAALLFAALVLGGALAGNISALGGVRLGVYASLAVAIRQSYAWLAAPIALAGVLLSPWARLVPASWRHSDARTGALRSSMTMVGALLPLVLAGFFIMQWGGLLPRSSDLWSKDHNLGPNLATPAFALALIAVFGSSLLPMLWRELLDLRTRSAAALLASAIGLASALLVPTASTRSTLEWGSAEWKMRNYGALWRLVDVAPVVAERSVLIALLAPLGAVGIVMLYRAARRAGRGPQALILLTSMSGWLAAQTMNSMAWQRYFEPIMLLVLGWLAAMGWQRAHENAFGPRHRKLMLLGPFALVAGLLAITVLKAHLPALRAVM